MITDSFLAEVRATTQRYEDRTPEREENKRVIEERGVLHADAPDLVERRLDRLGVDWGLARAVERTGRDASTGRSLDDELAPEGFGADVLALERMMGHNDLWTWASSSAATERAGPSAGSAWARPTRTTAPDS
jgi:endonuclease G, mitochondrial